MRVEYGTLKRDAGYPVEYICFTPEEAKVERTILAVHGFGGSKESRAITMLAEAMESENTAVISFDLPAHGHSSVDESCLTVACATADLSAMADFVDERYPSSEKTVFATSFGGFLTLLCAARFQTWRMVLRAPAVTMPRILLSNVLRITEEQFEQFGEVVCPFERPIHLRFACYKDMLSYAERVDAVERPLLIVQGDVDEIVPLEHIRNYADAHASVRLEIIEGANHRFQAEGTLERAIELAKRYILSDSE